MTPLLLMFLNKWISKQQKLQLSSTKPFDLNDGTNIFPSLPWSERPSVHWAVCTRGFIILGLACSLDCFCEVISCNNYPFSRPLHPPQSTRSSPHIIYLDSPILPGLDLDYPILPRQLPHIARLARRYLRYLGAGAPIYARACAGVVCTSLIKPLARAAPSVIKANARWEANLERGKRMSLNINQQVGFKSVQGLLQSQF